MSRFTENDHAAEREHKHREALCVASHLQGKLEARIEELESLLARANRSNERLNIENEERMQLLEKLSDRRFYLGSMTAEDHAADVDAAIEAMKDRIATSKAWIGCE